MKLEKGLFQDCSETDQPPGTYRFAWNIVESNLLGVKENESGFTNLNVSTPYTFIGSIPISEEEIVVFSTDNTNSEVGRVNLVTGVYTAVYNDPALDFDIDHPIIGEFRKEVNNQRVVVWTDSKNTRILNIDDLSGINDIEDLNVFQSAINPHITSYAINDFGGSLKTSAVIPITKYRNVDGSETAWFVHDRMFYINDDAKSEAFNSDDGAEPGTSTNKSVSFTFTGVDTRYDTIVIGYIQIVNNITSAYQAYSKSVSSTLSVSITGTESTTDISLDEVLTSDAIYTSAKAITQLGGQLYLANLTSEAIPELQQTALGVQIDYTHNLLNVLSNTGSHKDTIPPTFMPGDVYAFYLGVELKTGGWSFYHIPGRELTGPELATVIDSNLGLTYKKYQVDDTNDNGSYPTNMGGWYNDSETYPNNDMFDGTSLGNPDLRNLNVRHHRFPTVAELMDRYYTGSGIAGITHLVRLGIQVSNVNIPVDIQPKINQWKVFFAKKTSQNSLVLGSDLYEPGVGTQEDANIRWSTGGNWRLEANEGGSTEWKDFNDPIYDTIRGHGLDYLHDTSHPVPTYAYFNYKLRRELLNTQFAGFRSAGCRLTVCGEGNGNVASAVIDYTVTTQTTRVDNAFRKRLDNFSYVPANALSGKFKTQYTEGVWAADIFNPGADFTSRLTSIALHTSSSGEGANFTQFRNDDFSEANVGAETLFMQYYRLLTDVHVSYNQQDLIPVSGYGLPATTVATCSGGDTFLSYMSYLTAGPQNSNPDSTIGKPYEEGVRIWKGYVGYSRKNFNYRYQTQGNLSTYYHGKTDVRTLFSPTVTDLGPSYITLVNTSQAQNVMNYDTSMNASNEFSVGVISSPDLVQATAFPNTIIWSPVQSEESKEFSWRSFPAGNRYTINKNKGDIVNIQGIKNKELIIHTKFTIYRTRTDADVQAEGENIFFKSANLFDLPPEELVPTATGYGGTQNKFACVLTKAGYIYPNDLQGKLFLYDGNSLEEISTYGNRIFFRDFMGIAQDNPFSSVGYTIGYDETMNRVVVTKKNGATSWTISYNPVKKSWIGYHGYTPDYMFNTLGGELYSCKSNVFWKNKGGVKGVYYAAEPQPSYIDVTFGENSQDKEFESVQWITEIYDNTFVNGQPSTNLDYDRTCTHFTARGADHSIGRVLISIYASLDESLNVNVTRNLNRTWSFNDLRDIVISQGFLKGFYDNFTIDDTKLNTNMEWYDQRRFIDKYLTCRFEYDNLINSRFLFLEANVTYNNVER